ncbi:MAB_1171c family putative transporter [Streptomyces sp. NPDC001787]|uniref:MAB_1171c family putative transporter n=1 Tax=Streptomyces sp. NPDC001787 TaxID=3154523 RepID=UPI0033274263
MSEHLSNVVYLSVAMTTLMLALWKALALRRDPTAPLALTASMLLCATFVYAMAAPVGYRTVGQWAGEPSFATLPVYLGILTCFSLVHIITLLWDPRLSQQPQHLRRTVSGWVVGYLGAATLMIIFFLLADLDHPADPLRFNTAFADDPMVLLFLAVFLATLSSGTLNTFRQCRSLRLSDPQLQHSLQAFGVAMLGVFGYVVCGAPAIAAAALGYHGLDTVGVFGSTCGVIGTIVMCYGLSGSAVAVYFRQRQDFRRLQPLWELVVAGVDEDLAYSSDSSRKRLPAANVGFNLHRRVIEILDGTRALRRWLSPVPVERLYSLAAKDTWGKGGGLSGSELQAAATAAALRDAVRRLQELRESPVPGGTHQDTHGPSEPTALPGDDTPAGAERERLLLVAKALSHPLVAAALQESTASAPPRGPRA